jgi:hypothetical protein
MSGAEIALAVVGALALGFWMVWVPAQRLDRMHKRVATARASLGHQLTARAVAALDLAHAAVLDPASSIILATSARAAVDAMAEDGGPEPDSGPIQSELSATIRFAVGGAEDVAAMDEAGRDLVQEVATAWHRVVFARSFYNEAVAVTRRRRQSRAVRWAHLAGYVPMPEFYEMDDAIPEDLAAPPR